MSTGAAALAEPRWVRCLLIGAAVSFLGLFLVLPLVAVFTYAFADGLGAWAAAVRHPEALAAVRLTLLCVAIAVPLNLVFGVAAAWLIARFRFWGKSALVTLIDLPFCISPVVAGLLFVLLFGRQGWFGPWLIGHSMPIVFAVPGIVLATVFVTLPIIAREVLPVLEAQGCDEEEAAVSLGASGWQTFTRVTLPKIRWGVVYGVVLASARAMGEFGAVSVVSGHVRGRTNTVPLHVEILYNEYNSTGAFAIASLLTLVALATLIAKKAIEWRTHAKAAALQVEEEVPLVEPALAAAKGAEP